MEAILFNSRMVLSCAFAVVWYEQFFSFPSELEAVWRSKQWSLAKFAFIVNRYCALAGMSLYMLWMYVPISPGICGRWHWLPYLVSLLSLSANDWLMGLRTYAVWQKNTVVGIILQVLLTGVLATAIWTSVFNYAMPLTAPEKGCLSLPGLRVAEYAYVPWVICSIYEIVCLGLMMYRVRKLKKQGGSDSPVVGLLFTDGIQYFVVVICCKLASMFNFIFNTSNPALLVPFTAVVASIMCSRLFFGMCEQAKTPKSAFGSRASRSWRSAPNASHPSASHPFHSAAASSLHEERSVKGDFEMSTASLVPYDCDDVEKALQQGAQDAPVTSKFVLE